MKHRPGCATRRPLCRALLAVLLAGPALAGGPGPSARAAGTSEAAALGPARNITFDDLKFEIADGAMFERSMLTEPIEKLLGRKIRVRGFILPSSQQQLNRFTLVRDNKECCFGPRAKIYDCIRVQLTGGKQTEYTTLPIAVEGVLSIKELRIGGQIWAIYYLDADSAQ